MALTGDFARLSQLRERLNTLARDDGLRPIFQKLSDEAHSQAIRGFVGQRDPYGKMWPARKSGGSWPLLDKSGIGINRLSARPTSTGVRISTVGYMKYHLTGTRFMPARKWAPIDGLGPFWGDAFLQVLAGEIRNRLGLT
jgi:hypothetical protein